MAVEELVISPRDSLFRPGRQARRGMLDKPHGLVTVFCVPCRHESTFNVEPSSPRQKRSPTDMDHPDISTREAKPYTKV
jgi:hypothetical protein